MTVLARPHPDTRTPQQLARDIATAAREIHEALEQIDRAGGAANAAIWDRYSAAYARLTNDNALLLRASRRPIGRV